MTRSRIMRTTDRKSKKRKVTRTRKRIRKSQKKMTTRWRKMRRKSRRTKRWRIQSHAERVQERLRPKRPAKQRERRKENRRQRDAPRCPLVILSSCWLWSSNLVTPKFSSMLHIHCHPWRPEARRLEMSWTSWRSWCDSPQNLCHTQRSFEIKRCLHLSNVFPSGYGLDLAWRARSCSVWGPKRLNAMH